MKKHTFYISGMKCASCVVLTETRLMELENVHDVKVSLASRTIECICDYENLPDEHIAKTFTEALSEHGYSVTLEPQNQKYDWREFSIASCIAAVLVALFLFLQKLDIIQFIGSGEVTYGTAFMVGLIASVSSCMAVVGGLILGMSSTFEQQGGNFRSTMMFHVGRFISFFIFGGVLGLIGSTFQISLTANFILSIVVGLVMLILGINLLELFPKARGLQFTLPGNVLLSVKKLSDRKSAITPFIVGVATFILPCGFTQSMQLYALTTGNFWVAALIMTAFAFGTFPVLFLLSISPRFMKQGGASKLFFKSAGLVVVFFSLFTILTSMSAYGLIPPLFNF